MASTQYWPLDEQSPPASAPCTYITVTVGTLSSCVYPASAGACPVSTSSWLAVPASAAAVPGTLTFKTAAYGTVPAEAVGLHVSVPWLIEATAGGFTASLSHPSGYVLL